MVCSAHKTQIKENPRSMIRKLTITYLLLIPNQSTDKKAPKLFFLFFLKITSYFHFFIVSLQGTKPAATTTSKTTSIM